MVYIMDNGYPVDSGQFQSIWNDGAYGITPTGGRVYGPGQQFSHPPPWGAYECSDEQLCRVGYQRPTLPYPPYRKNRNPKIRQQVEGVQNYTSSVTIRCLEPPPLPAGQRTIVEVRPPPPPSPPPIVTRDPLPERPPTLPPLILRQRPPQPPPVPPNDIHYFRLPTPPAPPPRRIHHIYRPCPPKPRDIIIERWLPYKRSLRRKLNVVPAPPYNPIPVRDVIIEHVHPEAGIVHEIRKYPQPIPTHPEPYMQQYGHTLLDEQELKERLFSELSAQRASEYIFQHLQAIFRVDCEQNHEPIGVDGFVRRSDTDNNIPSTGVQFPHIDLTPSSLDEHLRRAALWY